MKIPTGKVRSAKVYGQDFWKFFNSQSIKIRERILWTIRLVQDLDIVSEKHLKHLEGTDGLYEMRVNSGSDTFRIFCFFDRGQLIILLNGFQKKSQKTPAAEIRKAVKLKRQYDEETKK